jgi:transglutaminase-like putative cysteine protease
MKVTIDYRAVYHYENEVSFSPHIYRLFPRVDRFVEVKTVKFATNDNADVQYRRDLFDNEIARCYYPGKGRDLKADLWIELELQERNAFHFLLESHALDFPFQYLPHERQVLAPCMEPQTRSASVELPFWQPKPAPTVSFLVELNDAIFDNIKYERREEGAARDPAETLALGTASCRDYAVLLAETLRKNGIAARLASGYLCEFDEAKDKRAEGALHAWVEAYVPGAGWLGMDPTNGTFCNHNHITAAVGLVPDDISPMVGNFYYDKTHVPSKMDVVLKITGHHV